MSLASIRTVILGRGVNMMVVVRRSPLQNISVDKLAAWVIQTKLVLTRVNIVRSPRSGPFQLKLFLFY